MYIGGRCFELESGKRGYLEFPVFDSPYLVHAERARPHPYIRAHDELAALRGRLTSFSALCQGHVHHCSMISSEVEMRLISLKIAVTVASSVFLVLMVTVGAVAAPPWSDAPASWWVSSYGVSEAQVATVADGYPDGTFRPGDAVTRGQFAKMAVNGLGVDTVDPEAPTFKDVPKGSTFFAHIEGAYEAELIGGYATSSGLYYRPANTITRQQANSILGRYLSDLEIRHTGVIHGDFMNYGSLDLWYKAEGEGFYLMGKFDDAGSVLPDHRATTAYLSYRDIVKGSDSRLNPNSTLIRSQAAALILRVKAEAEAILTPPPAPVNLGVVATGMGRTVVQTGTASFVGNDPTPQVQGDTLSSRPIAVYDDGVKLLEDTSTASGKFYADIMNVLGNGTHNFTAKVKNANGLVSPASTSVAYLLDTVPPTGSITAPLPAVGEEQAVVTSPKPAFTVAAADEAAGVKSVQFEVAAEAITLVWQNVSTDYAPDDDATTYAAVWPSFGPLAAGLEDGDYLFRAVVTDVAGNECVLGPLSVKVSTTMPAVAITLPEPNGGTTFPGWFVTESPAPVFTATVSEPAAGIEKVDFFYAEWIDTGSSSVLPGPAVWDDFTLLATDASAPYEALYSSLSEGRYIFAVRATDVVGNQSGLLAGSTSYEEGVAQEVIIDYSPPVVTILGPDTGDQVEENKTTFIQWMLHDVTPPDWIKIEYTLDGSAADPEWVELVDSTSNDGQHPWAVPDVNGDHEHVQIRITASDKAATVVGNAAGHTAVCESGYFTIYDLPAPATSVVGEDLDTNSGIDGRDFHVAWTPSVSSDIVSQELYILRAGESPVSHQTFHPVATFDATTNSWTGDALLTHDSEGDSGVPLATGAYRVWIAVTDVSGHTAWVSSAEFLVTAD